MKIATAFKQIQKESEFLGLTFREVIEDVQKYGRMVYSERTVEAYRTILENSTISFTEVA
jgi:hypothetical protein